MKGRYVRQVMTLRGDDLDGREKEINDAIVEIQASGKKVISLQTQDISAPQYLVTDIIYEDMDEPVEDKKRDKKKTDQSRFIKQILTRLNEKELNKRQEQINNTVKKLTEAGAKIIHFNTSQFGITALLTPMWFVTDVLYEASAPIALSDSSDSTDSEDSK